MIREEHRLVAKQGAAKQAATEEQLPRTVGPWRLLERLGRGAYGDVYAAETVEGRGLRGRIAIKLIDPERAKNNPDMVRALADEADLLSKIRHPNIVSVFGFEHLLAEDGGIAHAMVMELVEGVTLRVLARKIRRAGAVFPLSAALFVLREVASGLVDAHALCDDDGLPLQLIHRDMKPANVMVTPRGGVKLLDFGLAWAARRRVQSTKRGLMKGTLPYMSPEQIRGSKLDHRTDLYSLGLITWELVTGHRFLRLGKQAMDNVVLAVRTAYETRLEQRLPLLRACLQEPAIHDLDEDASVEIERLFSWLLARKRSERPENAQAIVDRLASMEPRWHLQDAPGFLASACSELATITAPRAAWGSPAVGALGSDGGSSEPKS